MKVIEQAQATDSLADYAAKIDSGPVVVTSHGQPVAALAPIENADMETVSLSTNRGFLDLIERSRARASRGHDLARGNASPIRGIAPVAAKKPNVRLRRQRALGASGSTDNRPATERFQASKNVRLRGDGIFGDTVSRKK